MRFKSQEEFDKAKDEILEKVVPPLLHPGLFEMPRLKQEEIAILWAKDHTDVKSKMAICKFEARTLSKLKEILQKKYGIKSADDVFDFGRMRELAKPTNSREY